MTRRAVFAGASVRREDSSKRGVSGIALPFDEVFRSPFGSYRERFLPGSLKRWNRMVLNFQHDSGRLLAGDPGDLEVTFGQKSISYRATLPETRLADETLALIDSGAISGASIEFVSKRSELVDGVRVVTDGSLFGIGLVSHPAYQRTSAERRYLYGV